MKKGFIAIILALLFIPTANAAYFNLGSLDVRPVQTEGSQNQEWFIEYLKPGEQLQKQIQISNFSIEPKTLKIYTTETSSVENSQFFTKNPKEPTENLNSWIKLPVSEITLQGGESQILSVNFDLPGNAGVGLHTGAIMVREIRENNSNPLQNFAVEKGVRVYLNVTGAVIKRGKLQKVTTTQSANEYNFHVQTKNEGTVDLNRTYEFKLKPIFGENNRSISITTITQPQTTETHTLSIAKPAFGIYQVLLSGGGNAETLLQTAIFIPLWLVLAALIALVALAAVLKTSPVELRFQAQNTVRGLSYDYTYRLTKNIFSSPEFQRSAAYLGLLTLIATITLSFIGFDSGQLQTQTFEQTAPCTYDLTIKWGDLRNLGIDITETKKWTGRVYFPNATITIDEYLHFERNDKAEIVNNNSALDFDLTTGPDNDGIILRVESLTNETPIIRYENFINNETVEFLITDFMNSAGTYPDGLWATSFKSALCEEEKIRQRMLELSTLEDLMATPELLATAEIEATPPAGAHIPELENLFIEELPATPEALSDFILNSDYVQQITKLDSTRKIETDTILLKALEATPNILQEIAATPDLNFMFIPADTIFFPPLEFSFTDEKIVRQELGTLIFVQNKEEVWNTFVGSTDFELLSGDLRIPASALTIDPGDPIILGRFRVTEDPVADPALAADQTNAIEITEEELSLSDTEGKIQAGEKRTFKGKFDKSTLVNVDPTTDMKVIFVLRPSLEIKIPAGMPAGTYQGELTITSI